MKNYTRDELNSVWNFITEVKDELTEGIDIMTILNIRGIILDKIKEVREEEFKSLITK